MSRRFLAVGMCLALLWPVSPASVEAHPAPPPRAVTDSPEAGPAPQQRATPRRRARPRYTVPTYQDSTRDDNPEYDDPTVRQAAVEALGRLNGSVVAVDPDSGRILAIVNQRMAFSEGFQPCSTFKPVVALAALREGLVRPDTMVRLGTRQYMSLTEAMAQSNNPYFEELGRRMGFETVERYARMFGLGEPAGLAIPEEHPGVFPSAPPERGGVARMSSFGEGIRMTPLQLASLASTFANGGTVYHLQYPRTEAERRNFMPRVKRHISFPELLPDVRDGLLATVLYGTGRMSFQFADDPVLGKTGTCSDQGGRLGWFAAYSDQLRPRLVLVVLLRGSAQIVNGPRAAEISGGIFRRLHERGYFGGAQAASTAPVAPAP
jgi:penicillin-binding protein 2